MLGPDLGARALRPAAAPGLERSTEGDNLGSRMIEGSLLGPTARTTIASGRRSRGPRR